MSQLRQILLFNAKRLEEQKKTNMSGCLGFSLYNPLMHYTTRTHSKERGQLHNGLLFLLQGGQQAQKFLLYQEALRGNMPDYWHESGDFLVSVTRRD